MWTLKLQAEFKDRLWCHLFPESEEGERVLEQAAFLYCKAPASSAGDIEVVGADLMGEKDFAVQWSDHLELSGDARARVIKTAHLRGAFLAEVHSHPSTWPAEFSWSDRSGLRDTVPHMRWRLKGCPYLALVVGRTTFDSLIWIEHEQEPVPLRGIEVDGVLETPTNLSLARWDQKDVWDG